MIKTLIILIFFFSNLYSQIKEYENGLILLRQGKYQQAILAFKEAIKKNPYYKEAYNQLGLSYYQKKEWKNAILSFKKALSLDASYNEVNNNLGLAYKACGKIDNAIVSFKTAIKNDPTSPNFHYNLANCLYKKGLILDSEKEYQKAIEIEPSFYLGYIGLGDIYLKDKNEKEKAIIFYEDSKAKNPKSSLPHISLGRLYYQNNEIDKAIWEYKKAISKDKNSIDALIELGRLYIEKGNYKDAKDIYKRLDVSQNPIIKYSLGFIYEKEGMHNEALKSYEDLKDDELSQYLKEKILLKEPFYSEARKDASLIAFKSADDYLKKRMPYLSIYEHKRAISLNPQEIKIRLSFAGLYENYGMFKEALDEISKVIELSPLNIEASDAIERISFKKKRTLGIEDVPKPDLRLSFFGITSKELMLPGELEYLNNLLASLLSYSKKLSLYQETSKFNDKDKAIAYAKEAGSDFLLHIELAQNKIEAKLIDLKNLKEDDIIVEIKKSKKEALYYLSLMIDEKLPIIGRIFEIKEKQGFINMGRLSYIKEGDIFNLLEEGKVIGRINAIKVDANVSSCIVLPPQPREILKIGQEVLR